MANSKALGNITRAKRQMQIAEKHLREFLKSPERRYTRRETERRKRLASEFRQSMDRYLESMLRAAQS